MIDPTALPEATAILDEFGVVVVPKNVVPKPGQTRAVGTLNRIIVKRGRDHGKFVVMTLAESANAKAHIDEVSLWAVSDLVKLAERNYPQLVTNDVQSWFEFFDGLPLGWLQFWSTDMDGVVPKRFALVGMVYERMKRVFGPLREQPDFFDDRTKIS